MAYGWATLSKVGFNAEVIIQEEGTPKSSEMMCKTPGLESLWMARRESGSLSLSTRARRHRRRRRIGEIRLSNGARHGASVDIRKHRTPLCAELYQVVLGQALSRGKVKGNVSIVPALPAAPVVPALLALIGIAGPGNQQNAGPGKVRIRRGRGACSPISEDIALRCAY